jgi:peroxiredoxin
MRKLVIGLVALGAIALVSIGRRAKFDGGPAVAGAAPEFQVADLAGQPVSLTQYRGQVVLLNFWASWCSTCKEEMPDLDKLHARMKAKGFTVLALSVDEGGRKPVMGFVARYNPAFPVALSDRATASAYGVYGLPVSFLIDQKGVVRRVYHGPIDEPAVENDILSLVSKS